MWLYRWIDNIYNRIFYHIHNIIFIILVIWLCLFSEVDWGLRSVNFNPFRFSLWFLCFFLLGCRSICIEWNLIGGDEFPLNSFRRVGSIVVPVSSNPQTIWNLWFWLGFGIHLRDLLGSIPSLPNTSSEGGVFVRVCFWGPNTSKTSCPSQPGTFIFQAIRHRKVYCQHLSTPQGWAWHATMSISCIISWLMNILWINDRIDRSFPHDRLMTGPWIVHLNMMFVFSTSFLMCWGCAAGIRGCSWRVGEQLNIKQTQSPRALRWMRWMMMSLEIPKKQWNTVKHGQNAAAVAIVRRI